MRCDTRRLPARVDSLDAARRYVGDCADRVGLDPQRRFAVLLALEEAFVNVCGHAYPGAAGDVELACEHREGAFVLEIGDAGVGFDVLSHPTPDLSAGIEERPLGGLGIHLIRSVAKGVTYRRDGPRNVLRMEFPPAASADAG